MKPYLARRTYPPFVVISSIIIGIALNGMLNLLCQYARLPIFMDSIFTITIAACFGWLPGLIVGVGTNFVEELLRSVPGNYWPFALVNAYSALVTAAMVRLGYTRSFLGIFILVAVLALGNSLLGALIVTLVYGGTTGEPLDSIVRSIILTGQGVFTAAFLGRIFINVVDKGLALFVMVPIYRYLTERNASDGAVE